jgi:hypothetical protein
VQIQVSCQAKSEGSESAAYAKRLQFRRRDLIGGCFGAAVGLVCANFYAVLLFVFQNTAQFCVIASQRKKW